MKYRDTLTFFFEILKPPLRLLTHIMEERVKIFETYPKYKEIIRFLSHIFVHLQTDISDLLNRTAMFWL